MIRRTERLLLRELSPQDWPAVHRYQSDPRYLRYYHWTERRPEAVRAFVEGLAAAQEPQPRLKYNLAIVLPDSDELIGITSLRRKHADGLDGELGYELAPSHWGQGYATEAASAMLALAFDLLGLHRVSSECIAENEGSARVLERLGMTLEGRLRENEWMKGRWWDTLIYGILQEEWKARQPA